MSIQEKEYRVKGKCTIEYDIEVLADSEAEAEELVEEMGLDDLSANATKVHLETEHIERI